MSLQNSPPELNLCQNIWIIFLQQHKCDRNPCDRLNTEPFFLFPNAFLNMLISGEETVLQDDPSLNKNGTN